MINAEQQQDIGELCENELFTTITLLNEEDFIDRYAEILGKRDNVIIVGATASFNEYPCTLDLLRVYPYTFEDRLKSEERLEEIYRSIGAEEKMLLNAQPPNDPMTKVEIAQIATEIKSKRRAKEENENLSKIKKMGQNLLYILGLDKLKDSTYSQYSTRIPDAIEIINPGTGISEVYINQEILDSNY